MNAGLRRAQMNDSNQTQRIRKGRVEDDTGRLKAQPSTKRTVKLKEHNDGLQASHNGSLWPWPSSNFPVNRDSYLFSPVRKATKFAVIFFVSRLSIGKEGGSHVEIGHGLAAGCAKPGYLDLKATAAIGQTSS
jgi:hypothetical protein